MLLCLLLPVLFCSFAIVNGDFGIGKRSKRFGAIAEQTWPNINAFISAVDTDKRGFFLPGGYYSNYLSEIQNYLQADNAVPYNNYRLTHSDIEALTKNSAAEINRYRALSGEYDMVMPLLERAQATYPNTMPFLRKDPSDGLIPFNQKRQVHSVIRPSSKDPLTLEASRMNELFKNSALPTNVLSFYFGSNRIWPSSSLLANSIKPPPATFPDVYPYKRSNSQFVQSTSSGHRSISDRMPKYGTS
uniref:Uncharacterized protein n=1 Tax=Syphacia muris TaxID=451379 RepID=A0A0N5AEE0_9BILA